MDCCCMGGERSDSARERSSDVSLRSPLNDSPASSSRSVSSMVLDHMALCPSSSSRSAGLREEGGGGGGGGGPP